MLIINFDKNELCKKAYGLWQYDYGQVLRIQGLNLPTAAEIHFALQETGGEAVTRIGITKDGVTDVTIPDSLLEADGASQDYQIYVFVYLATPESGETTRRITLGVKSRPRPEAFNTPGEGELFEEAIQAVNDAAKRAEDAGKEATAAAGEARESASQAGKYLTDTQALAEQVEINADAVAQGKEEAARLLAQTQSAASNAALSAETAKQSETAAREAQTAAETAEDTARQYAGETEADRREVAESKQFVEQMQSNVARMQTDVRADKEAVEQTVSKFGTAAQDALTAIGQAQNTAVSAVTEEGRKQVTAVRETGTQAVSEVDTAKTAAVGAVTAEGDVQVVRIQEAAAEIAADREQIQQNKTNIATLTDKTNTLAPGIVLGAKGGAIAVDDASERPFAGLSIYGKSMQEQTTGAQLFDAAEAEMNAILDMDGTTSANGNINTSGFVKVSPNTKYSVSSTRQNRGKFYDINKRVLTTDKFDFELSNSRDKFTTPENVEYVRFSIYGTENLNNVMVNVGDILKPWEPYTGGKPSPSPEYPQEITSAGDKGTLEVKIADSGEKSQRLIIQTPNGLPGILVKSGGNYTDETGQQWICDEIDLERGKYVQRIRQVKFNGTENWKHRITNSGNNNFQIMIYDYKSVTGTGQPCFCNYLPYKNFIWDDNIVNLPKIYSYDLEITASFPPESEFKSVEIWNSWLKEKGDFKFQYVLATPIERDLSPEEIAAYKSLHTYSGITVVTNDSGAGMSLTYTVDTKKYIDEKIAAISAAMIGG